MTVENPNELDQLKQALTALKKAQSRLDAIEKSQKEPIAIIGMGCRFPGSANSPEAFWRVLESGTNAITEVPPDRWDADALYDSDPAAPGKMSSRRGGFIDSIDQFDANFFGISPREAAQMDPQQRLVLEVTWEALEDAGLTKAQLARSQTGVYVGVHGQSTDYVLKQYADLNAIDIYTGTGTAHNVIGGRISYLFDLRGPTITVDTACSSSLVAVHLACQSLRQGESQMAIVAGVNLILSPEFTIAASKMHMLAPDGHCKAFDARADGFVRGEGCGVVILKRLSEAVAAGDNILGLIRGSAINQDGHTNGLTAPNGLSQQQVIRVAIENAGVEPSQIGYVEAHGTGTSLGDVIELESLISTVGQSGPGSASCYLGSAKTNIGHLEGAAGIAGLIKALLILRNQAIPPVVHFQTLNPNISLDNTRLKVPSQLQPWKTEQKRLAGVSSFGWSGTNAHVILEEAPAMPLAEKATSAAARAFLLPLSAQSKVSLNSLAQSYSEFLLSATSLNLLDICSTTSLRRTHHEHRLAVSGKTPQELAERLKNFLQGKASTLTASGYASPDVSPRIAFVFPGQGSQWIGMGRELFEKEPVFRESILECEQAIQKFADWKLTEQLQSAEENSRINEIDVIQPTLFAIQVALAALWKSWGVTPDAVIGHSMGEIAAAHIAGALDLQNAARVICTRSRLLRLVSGQGVMAVVGLSLEQAGQAVSKYQNQISVAVSNSPRSTVVSGDPAAMQKLFAELEAKNIFCRLVKVDVASHSPQMDPLLGDLLAELKGLESGTTTIPLYSTVTGNVNNSLSFGPSYWADNLRKPVLFSTMVEKLLEAGHTILIEISSHPILLSAIEESLHHWNKQGHTVASLLRNEPEQEAMLGSLGKLYTIGFDVDWKKQYPAGGRFVRLPKYVWDHQRHWIKTLASRESASGRNAIQVSSDELHPFLGIRLPSMAHLPRTYVWQTRVDASFRKYLKENLIENVIEAMAYAAAAAIFGDRTHLITQLDGHKSLDLETPEDRTLQFILTANDNPTASFQLHEQPANSVGSWTKLAEGNIELGQANAEWLYRLDWQRRPLQENAAADNEKASWLILSDQTGLGKELANLLEANGQTCFQVLRGDSFQLSGKEFTIDPTNPQQYGQLWATVTEKSGLPLRGIIYLWALDAVENELSNIQQLTMDGLLHIVHALLNAQQEISIWAVTRGVQPVAGADNVSQSLLWGFGRNIAIEHPELWGGLIDLDAPVQLKEEAQRIFVELFGISDEKQIALRGSERYVPRLVRDDFHGTQPTDIEIHPDATYLVTGGLGGLGLELADWLAGRGAKHLVITSRTGLPAPEEWDELPASNPDARKIDRLRRLEALGLSVTVAKADVSDHDAMSELFRTIKSTHPALRGVFQLAGLEDNTPVKELTVEQINRVLDSKVTGTWNLHTLTQELDFLILFSSAAAVWGSKGLAHYGAANHFMDILAHQRRSQGLPTLSINWGWWESGNMGGGELGQLFADVGLSQMPAKQGFEAMWYLLRSNAAQAVVADVDWNTFKPIYEARETQPLLEYLITEKQTSSQAATTATENEFAKQLCEMSGARQREALLTHVRGQVADVLGLDVPEKLDVQQGFFKLGMDSITTVRLRSKLEGSLECTLPPTVAFEYPSVELLTGFILQEVFASSASPAARVESLEETAKAADHEDTSKLKDISDDELFALLDDEISGVDKLTKGN